MKLYLFLMLLSMFAICLVHAEENCPDLTGRIVRKDAPEYDSGRLVANYYASKNEFPDVIVYAQNTQDVQNAVKWARCHKKPIRIRSGGHNHEGFSTGTDVVLIDVREMTNVDIDKEKNLVKVQPGINNLELYAKLNEQKLTHVGGTCSDVGLSGLVLSGGMGVLLRRLGLTCDSLVSVEMVDANGNIITATKDNAHKDLFWATCGGGGGNFGVITSLTLKVYPADPVTWFNIGWDWDQPVDKVIATWQDLFGTNDHKWFSHLDIWSKSFPTEKLKKQPIKALGVYWGTPEEARRDLGPLLSIGKPTSEMIETVTWNQAMKLIEESTAVFLTDKPEYKSTGAFANKNLPPEAIQIIHKTLSDTSSPLFNVLLFSMGGATAEVKPNATAYYYRDAKFFVNYSIQWLQSDEDAKQKVEIDTLREKLLPFTLGDYIGNPDRKLEDYLITYYGDNVRKLRCVKRKYDPENVFGFQQGIPPAPADWNCVE